MEANDTEILNWDQLGFRRNAILFGNGASVAVWPRFQYDSIFEQAQQNEIDNPLSDLDVALFNSFRTTNFERILSALLIARDVNLAIQVDALAQMTDRYESIRRALFQAIRSIHIPWNVFSDNARSTIRNELRSYSSVFSTNYDLIAYWSILVQPHAAGFVDFFWNQRGVFDITDLRPYDNDATKIYYLHGGIHLYRTIAGDSFKRFRDFEGSLLIDIAALEGNPVIPLLVSEGNSRQKLISIRNSDYLNFAYERLGSLDGPLVIFGHSLDESDRHLYDAINAQQGRQIEISVSTNLPLHEKIAYMARARQVFPLARLQFFDSQTHPLGSLAIRHNPTEAE